MTNVFEPAAFGDHLADVYDALPWAGDPGDAGEAVQFLTRLAGLGPVLELGIGTGRIALPLAAATGLPVHGVESSPAMAQKLRSKPGGGDLRVTIGDAADLHIDGPFTLAYDVGTLGLLSSQERQVRCFQRVAQLLVEDGRFVLQVPLPDPARYDRGQRVQTFDVDRMALVITATRYDAIDQRSDGFFVRISNGDTRLFPVHQRYVWPSELDLMAMLAGLVPEGRWGDWDRRALDSSCEQYVAVYRKSSVDSPH